MNDLQTDDHGEVFVERSIRFAPTECAPAVTNFVGAGWGSSHDPDYQSDHAPGVSTAVVSFGPDCPPGTNVTVALGWTHDADKLWTRNLPLIPTGDPKDDNTDHCIAVEWVEGGAIDLQEFLDATTVEFFDFVDFYVNGKITTGEIRFGGEPKAYHPEICHVELRLRESGQTLDRMWLVVVGGRSRERFDDWFEENSRDLSWTDSLPRPYPKLEISAGLFGRERAVDPEPGAPGLWGSPHSVNGNLLHHDAAYEMRSVAVAGGHGNQACYRADGSLNRSGISGGTADFSAAAVGSLARHIRNDVNPFLLSVQLDGNPCDVTVLNNISRPCIRQGETIRRYIQCRPVVLP